MEGQGQPGSKIPPRAPKRVLGTPGYYDFRARMYEEMHPGEEAPKYYKEFGGFFATKFNELRPVLTDERSKQWVDQTMFDLQLGIENALQNGTLDDSEPGAVDRFATEMHSELYKKNGFGELLNEDQQKILWSVLSEGRARQFDKLWEGRELLPEVFQLILEEDYKHTHKLDPIGKYIYENMDR